MNDYGERPHDERDEQFKKRVAPLIRKRSMKDVSGKAVKQPEESLKVRLPSGGGGVRG